MTNEEQMELWNLAFKGVNGVALTEEEETRFLELEPKLYALKERMEKPDVFDSENPDRIDVV